MTQTLFLHVSSFISRPAPLVTHCPSRIIGLGPRGKINAMRGSGKELGPLFPGVPFNLLLFRYSFGEIRNRVMGYAQELAPGVEAFKGVFL